MMLRRLVLSVFLSAFCFLSIEVLVPGAALAKGSIAWQEVKADISKTDPALVEIIETHFVVDRTGLAMLFGSHQGELGGMRIQPYEFEAIRKTDKKRYLIELNQCLDYEFTKRWCFEYKILK